MSGAAASRDINSARAFVHRGHGIGLLPSTYCEEDIANGKLIRLLPKWTSSPIPVCALYSSRKLSASANESLPGGAGRLEGSALDEGLIGTANERAARLMLSNWPL